MCLDLNVFSISCGINPRITLYYKMCHVFFIWFFHSFICWSLYIYIYIYAPLWAQNWGIKILILILSHKTRMFIQKYTCDLNFVARCDWLLLKFHKLDNIWWNDDEVHFVLDQHAELDFYSASSLKQQSAMSRFRATLSYAVCLANT